MCSVCNKFLAMFGVFDSGLGERRYNYFLNSRSHFSKRVILRLAP